MAEIVGNQRVLGLELVEGDMKIYNDQRVIGVVVVPEGTTIFNGQRVMPIRVLDGEIGVPTTQAPALSGGSLEVS